MKLSFICPTAYIPEYSGDFVMGLANYLDDTPNAYEKAILAANLPIVLDNGAFETGKPVGIDRLLQRAYRLKAKYFFAPDHMFNAKLTRDAFENTLYVRARFPDYKGLNVGVVVQANNLQDYLAEFVKYNEDPRVTVIGLSYLAIGHCMRYPTAKDIPSGAYQIKKHPFNPYLDPDFTTDRLNMLAEIEKLGLKNIKPVHLLGLGASHDDLKACVKMYPWVLYNDTSTCYMMAKNDLLLSRDLVVPGGKIREKINITDRKTKQVEELFNLNIKQVRKYVSN